MFACVYSVCRQRPCVGLIPRPRIPADCVWIKKLKKSAKVHKGCSATDRFIAYFYFHSYVDYVFFPARLENVRVDVLFYIYFVIFSIVLLFCLMLSPF
jgi:GT2 family glycosyltransferase